MYAVSKVSPSLFATPYTAEEIAQRIDELAAEAATAKKPAIILAEIATLQMVLNFMGRRAA